MDSPKNHSASHRGFTLIEIIASVTILAVLAILLVPAAGMLRQTSAKAKCANNLRQIGAAMMAYAADRNGMLPGATTWDREIASYLDYNGSTAPAQAEQIPVLACPADTYQRTSGKIRSYKPNAIGTDANVGVLAWTSSARAESRRLQELTRPGVTILLTETFGSDNIQFAKENSVLGSPGWLAKMSKVPVLPNGKFYHGPGQNYLFCDGHVELLIPLDDLNITLPDWDSGRWRAVSK